MTNSNDIFLSTCTVRLRDVESQAVIGSSKRRAIKQLPMIMVKEFQQ